MSEYNKEEKFKEVMKVLEGLTYYQAKTLLESVIEQGIREAVIKL